MRTGARLPGEFCWINLLTPRSAEAREFFGTLLGWTFVGAPGYGHMVRAGGASIGGLFDHAGYDAPKWTPPTISVMVRVADAEESRAKVAELGGKASAVFDVLDQGRMAVCSDPTGAAFDLWETRDGKGTLADSSRHGVPSWFELVSTDTGRAAVFYSELFGWAPEPVPSMPGAKYTSFRLGEEHVGGMLALTPPMGFRSSRWTTYFTVNDIEATTRTAIELGASLRIPVLEIPRVGRFCGLTSPQGVTFHLIAYAR